MRPLFEILRNADCRDCPLYETAQSVCLIGDGPYPADMMLVGEAPGWREDNLRKPFAGKAGRLLDSILDALGLHRKELYISNAVHCRPPDNRTPKADEVKACHKYLEKEISYVKPKLIIALGGTALKSLLGKEAMNVTNARGQYFKYKDSLVLATYHPAAALRTPSLAEYIAEDIKRGLERLNSGGNKKAKTDYALLTKENMKEAIEAFKESKAVSVDVETTDLDMYDPKEKLLSVAFSPSIGKGYCLLVDHPKTTWSNTQARDIAQKLIGSKRIIGHNIKFDLRWLNTRKIFEVDGQALRDTMVMFHLIDENYPDKRLKHLVRIHTKLGEYLEHWDTEAKKFSDKGKGFSLQVPESTLMKYNCGDTDGTYRLYEKSLEWLKEERMIRLLKYQGEATGLLLDIELAGFTIDQEKRAELTKEYDKQIKMLHKKLITGFKPDLNLNSSQQLAHLLYKKMKLPILERTAAGAPSVREQVLITLKESEKTPPEVKQWLQELLDYRLHYKTYTTYLVGLDVKADGKVHANYHQTGTVTGRLSCSDPNLQQIPREGPVKQMFVSSFRDGVIVQADYNQVELRVLAHYTQDENLLEAFLRNADIHRATAAKVYKMVEEKVTEQQRKAAKQVNFGIAYCISAHGLAAKSGMKLYEAEMLIEQWMRTYPKVPTWISQVKRDAMKYRVSWTHFGRKRRFTDVSPDSNEGRESLRQAVNFPIQSTASDLTVLSTVQLWRWLKEKGYRGKIVANVHDSVMIDCPRKEADAISRQIKEFFENPPVEFEFGFKLKCPLVVDIKVGQNWGTLEKVEASKPKGK